MSKKKCKIPDCPRSLLHGARGYCNAHYSRYYRDTSLEGPIRGHDGKQGCTIAECEKKHYSLGFCSTHYGRHWSGRPLKRPIQVRDGKQGCAVIECGNKHHSLGYCNTHARSLQYREKKLQLVIEFGERCADCRKEYPLCVFDFDNLGDPKEHTTLGKLLVSIPSWERIAEEVSKCDMVCSNCHRIRTQARLVDA